MNGPLLRVLVVDDEPSILELLGAYLRMRGHEVYLAPDGEAALAMLGELTVDVVLADVRMPGMGGLELLERVKALRHPTAFVLMTGHGSIGAAIAALRDGAKDYLLKPLKLREVQTALIDAVEATRKQQSAARLGQLDPLYADIRSTSGITLPRLYRRLCEHAAREVEAEGGMVALYEPAERRWREQVRTALPPFAGLNIDRLGEHLRAGGQLEDASLFWFGPSATSLRVEPIRAQLDPEGPERVVGLLALANPAPNSVGQVGPTVYAHAVGEALSRLMLVGRLRSAAVPQPDPEEHLRRVEELLTAPAQTLRLPAEERDAARRALQLWVSGVTIEEVLSHEQDRTRALFLALSERHDGHGSPAALRGGLPAAASLLSIACWWDLVTRATVAHAPLSADQARATLEGDAGRRFDPAVASIFMRAHSPTPQSESTLHFDD